MDAYYAFSDEAGLYDNHPSKNFLRSHPFYVRATVLISAVEYMSYQSNIKKHNAGIQLPIYEEIKWSDMWSKSHGKPRNEFIDNLEENDIKKYIEGLLLIAEELKSLRIILTFSDNRVSNMANKDTMIVFHLQEAMQRVDKEMNRNGFATFIIDELPEDCSSKAKNICYTLAQKGDFTRYESIYSGVLFEKSNLSVGVQLADYVAGIFNSFLKSIDSSKGNYIYAKEKFFSFIKPRLRKSITGEILGYGIREVTRNDELREKVQIAIQGDENEQL